MSHDAAIVTFTLGGFPGTETRTSRGDVMGARAAS